MTLDVRIQDTQKRISELLDRCDIPDRTWDNERSSKFVESVLLQIPTTIWLQERREDDRYAVIDGNQRLAALLDYVTGEFPLTGTSWHSELHGFTFQALSYTCQRKILEARTQCNIIHWSTPTSVVGELIRRIRS